MSSNSYDNMIDYITSIYQVVLMITRKANERKDRRLIFIAMAISNYVRPLADKYKVKLKDIVEPSKIVLIPIFEYIAANNIELYNFSLISDTDFDVSKSENIERFILTHIYHITQG